MKKEGIVNDNIMICCNEGVKVPRKKKGNVEKKILRYKNIYSIYKLNCPVWMT